MPMRNTLRNVLFCSVTGVTKQVSACNAPPMAPRRGAKGCYGCFGGVLGASMRRELAVRS